jgi:hypothetical protein
METNSTMDSAAMARHARFGTLPERISYTDMVEVKAINSTNRAGDAYNPEGSWMNFSCFAADLGL